MNNSQRIAKNTLFLYVRMALSLLITLYTSRVVLNVLGVEDFGVFNVVAGFVSMFAFLNSALNSSVQRYYNFENGKRGKDGVKQVYVASIYIQMILSVITLLLVETVGLWYFEHKLIIPPDRYEASKILFQVSVLSMVIVVMQVPYSSAILAKEKMDYYALVGVVDVLLKLAVVFIIQVISYDKLISYAWLLATVAIVDFLLYFVYSKIKFNDIRFELKVNLRLLGSMLKFSSWSAFSGFSQIIRNQGVNVVLNIFFGPVVNAARGISYQIKSALISFVGNITVASRPQMVESYAIGDIDRSQRLMYSTSKLCFVLLFMMALPITLEINYILNLWLNNTVPDHTAAFSVLVLAITLVDILQTPITMMVYATGEIRKYNFVTSMIGLSILPIAFFVLRIGVEPEIVYVISFFISVVIQVLSVIMMTKLTGYSSLDYLKKVALPLFLLLLFSCGFPYVPHHYMSEGFGRFIVVTVISIMTIGVVSYLIVFDKEEKLLIHHFVANLASRLCLKA